MAINIELTQCQLFGRECSVDISMYDSRVRVAVHMDGREFADEFPIGAALERPLVQAVIGLAALMDTRPIRGHVAAIAASGGRLPGPRLVIGQPDR